MKLTFRKHEIRDLPHLRELVVEHADAIEPGIQVIAQSHNLGRATVDLVGLDRNHTPVLIGLGLVADDQMIFRMLEAYAWSLEYPEALRRLAPTGDEATAWPPRVVFIGGRVLESFLRKIGLFNFPSVECFEFRCVDVNGATGFYLDAVDCTKGVSVAPRPIAAPRAPAGANGQPVGGQRVHPPARIAPREPSPAAGGPPVVAEPDPSPSRVEPVTNGPVPSPGGPGRAATAAGSEPPASPAPESGPTWRKFLERLAGTLEDRPAPDDRGATSPAPVPSALSPTETAPPATAGSPAGGVVGAQRGLLDSVTLPATVDVAPQWRKFLDGPVFDDTKVGVVREYLQREFPLCTIYDFHEYQRGGQVFQLQDIQGKVSQLATITADFFAARHDGEIRLWLEQHQLAQALRNAGQTGVVVTDAGIQATRR